MVNLTEQQKRHHHEEWQLQAYADGGRYCAACGAVVDAEATK